MQYWSKAHLDGQFLLGFSGGIDSAVLFHTLVANDIKFRAVHVIHGNSKSDLMAARLVRGLCKANDIPLVIRHASCANETQGRKQRLVIFSQEATENEVLILGHHIDDSAETMLINLFSGASVNGVAGISADITIGKLKITRPFLHAQWGKDDVLSYAKQNELESVDDEMNDNMDMKRNAVRSIIIPRIQKHFPQVKQKISLFIENCRKQKIINEHLYLQTDASLAIDIKSRISDSAYSYLLIKDMLNTEYDLISLENWFFYKTKYYFGVQLSSRHFREFLSFLKEPRCVEMYLPDYDRIVISQNLVYFCKSVVSK